MQIMEDDIAQRLRNLYPKGTFVGKGTYGVVLKINAHNHRPITNEDQPCEDQPSLVCKYMNLNSVFVKEGILFGFQHTNLVSFISIAKNPDTHHLGIVLPELIGFNNYLKSSRSLHTDLLTLVGLCRAIDFLHRHGFAHCDIGSNNVLFVWMNGMMVPKLIDYGNTYYCGTNLGDNTFKTIMPLCTMPFRSPETHSVSSRVYTQITSQSDVYAVGALFAVLRDEYAMHSFVAKDTKTNVCSIANSQMFTEHLRCGYQLPWFSDKSVNELTFGVGEKATSYIRSMVHPDPDMRPTAGDVLAMLMSIPSISSSMPDSVESIIDAKAYRSPFKRLYEKSFAIDRDFTSKILRVGIEKALEIRCKDEVKTFTECPNMYTELCMVELALRAAMLFVISDVDTPFERDNGFGLTFRLFLEFACDLWTNFETEYQPTEQFACHLFKRLWPIKFELFDAVDDSLKQPELRRLSAITSRLCSSFK